MMIWNEQHNEYLQRIQSVCQILSARYYKYHQKLGGKLFQFKLPSIILGSAVGLVSMTSTSFEPSIQKIISWSVGGVNLIIATITSIESFLKVGDNYTQSLKVSNEFMKLGEQISVELNLPTDERSMNGDAYIRNAHTTLIQIIEECPVLRNRIWTDIKDLDEKVFSLTRVNSPSLKPYKSKSGSNASNEIIFTDV